jgi:hypothetical protein
VREDVGVGVGEALGALGTTYVMYLAILGRLCMAGERGGLGSQRTLGGIFIIGVPPSHADFLGNKYEPPFPPRHSS